MHQITPVLAIPPVSVFSMKADINSQHMLMRTVFMSSAEKRSKHINLVLGYLVSVKSGRSAGSGSEKVTA